MKSKGEKERYKHLNAEFQRIARRDKKFRLPQRSVQRNRGMGKTRDLSKKVGKTTRPFRYDLNQIPYDYTVEVRNRFKGLDLIDKSA